MIVRSPHPRSVCVGALTAHFHIASVVHSELSCESLLALRCSDSFINHLHIQDVSVGSLIHSPRNTTEIPLQRSNLANARLKGLQEDLNLNDTQYATTLSVFFAGYIFVCLPRKL